MPRTALAHVTLLKSNMYTSIQIVTVYISRFQIYTVYDLTALKPENFVSFQKHNVCAHEIPDIQQVCLKKKKKKKSVVCCNGNGAKVKLSLLCGTKMLGN